LELRNTVILIIKTFQINLKNITIKEWKCHIGTTCIYSSHVSFVVTPCSVVVGYQHFRGPLAAAIFILAS